MRLVRLAVVVAVTILVAHGAHAEAPPFDSERAIRPAAAGPNRLEVDVPLLAGARAVRYAGTDYAGGLEDLRIYDGEGREVPHLVVSPPPERGAWTRASLSAIPATKRESGFEADLGGLRDVDRIRVEGLPAPFMKRFRLEGSGDRTRWTVLVAEGTLFDLPEEHLVQREVSFSAGAYRYIRMRWDDATSGRVGIPARVEARLSGRPAAAPPLLADVQTRKRESEPRHSRYRLRLPGRNLPVRALHVVVDGGHVLRNAKVTEARLAGSEVKPVVIGSATLKRAARGDLLAEEMKIAIERPSGPDLELVIDDGDNPPLAITAVRAEMLPLPSIYFEAPSSGELTARFGNAQLERPQYDLEAMREFITREAVPRATWGAVETAAKSAPGVRAAAMPIVGAVLDPKPFAYARGIAEGPTGLSSLLLDAAALAHSRNLADIRLVDEENQQLPYLVERRGEPLVLPLSLRLREPAGADRVTRYEVTLPWDTIPEGTLVLTTAARVFERTVTFSQPADAKTNRDAQQLATVVWRHADPELEAPQLSIPISPRSMTTIEIAIDEGDNTPLPIASAKMLLPQYGLRFFRPEGEVRLLYGATNATPPRYDLALLGSRLFGLPAAEIRPLPEGSTAAGSTRIQPIVFWAAVVLAVLVLFFLVFRMFRQPAGENETAAGDS